MLEFHATIVSAGCGPLPVAFCLWGRQLLRNFSRPNPSWNSGNALVNPYAGDQEPDKSEMVGLLAAAVLLPLRDVGAPWPAGPCRL